MLDFLPRQEVSPELLGALPLCHPWDYIKIQIAHRGETVPMLPLMSLYVFAAGRIPILSPKNAFDSHSLGQSCSICHLHSDSDPVAQYCIFNLSSQESVTRGRWAHLRQRPPLLLGRPDEEATGASMSQGSS